MRLDVCICSHNPRLDVLRIVIDALVRQTAPHGAFQVMLIDNASSPPLTEEILEPLRAAHIPAVLTLEPTLGVAAARLHAVRSTSAPWLLFVDDDNELAEDYVSEGLTFIAQRQDVGCFGGKLLLPKHLEPPPWVEPFVPYLAIKDAGDELITGAADDWGEWEPPTAGAWVRRDQLEAYQRQMEQDTRTFSLGRIGRNGLASCEDSLMARQSRELNLLNAYYPRLVLYHHLDPSRFRFGYLFRLMVGYGRSHVLLETVILSRRGRSVEVPHYYQGFRKFLRVLHQAFTQSQHRSLPFAFAMCAYHWSARRQYLLNANAKQVG